MRIAKKGRQAKKVTSMLEGNLCSKRVADEADFAASPNPGSLKAEKGFCTAKISSGKLGLKEESGKCNTCVHYEETSAVATNTNAFSGKSCRKKDSDLLSPRGNSPCGGRQRSSETSHPLSVCLSHESSENTESEETCWGFHTSEGTKKIIKSNLHPACAINSAPLKAPIFHDKDVTDQLEKQDSEGLGDNISFICGSECSKTRAGDRNNSASIDSFSETEKTVKGQDASCCLVGSPCGKRSNRSFNKCSKEILCCSNKSDFSEISSLRDSCPGASSAKGEHSDCSVEQIPSSFARADAVQVGSQIGGEHNSADSMQVDAGINGREQTDEVKSTTVVKKVHMEETTVRSWPVACIDGSDSIIEYDVKVCDICGDIGREESLAVCSKCNDGAEHIYCMRVKMDSVPKGDWMCEECVLSSQHNENRKQGQVERVKTLKRSCTLESETKGSEFEERKVAKVSSIPPFSSKRPAASIQSVRQRPSGTVLGSPSTSSSRRKILTHLSGGHSCSTTMKTVCVPTEFSRSPKLPSQSHVSKGFLSKSKSFSAGSLKEDVHLPKKASCHNEGLVKETAANESKGGVQMISKSASLKNTKSYSVNNSNHDRKLPRSFSHGEDMKVSRQPKEQCSTNIEKKLRLANSDSLASMADKRSASTGKNRLPHSSSSSCKDLRAEKGHDISNNSLKRSDHYAQGASTNTKHLDTNVHSDEHHVPSWISAIPQLDSTWQGKFEIQRSGGLSFTCDGMQAHLSTYASDKVLQLVPKLPPNLLLEEAPRETMWPTQFMKNHATEDNIALYFFAKDIDSYEGSYKNLLDRMIKNDFSLKWNFGGVELLIFTSNLLPENSRRWNNLLFLWGVFRGKMVHSSRQIPVVPASEDTLPLGKSSQSISASLVSCNTQKTLNSNTLLDSKAVTSGRAVEVCETKASSLEQKPPDIQTSSSQQVRRVDDEIKTEQFSRADTYQSKERASKRRLEIDLNCSLQESPEYSEDHTEADGEHDFKRLKSCLSGTSVGNNSIPDMNERCSVAINGEGPNITGEFKCDRADYMSIVSPQTDADGNKYRWKPLLQQVPQNDVGNQQDHNVSSLEVERNGSDKRNIPHFLKLMGGKEVRDGAASGDTNPSLDLSLALPFPKTSETKLPEWPEVKTTLSLF